MYASVQRQPPNPSRIVSTRRPSISRDVIPIALRSPKPLFLHAPHYDPGIQGAPYLLRFSASRIMLRKLAIQHPSARSFIGRLFLRHTVSELLRLHSPLCLVRALRFMRVLWELNAWLTMRRCGAEAIIFLAYVGLHREVIAYTHMADASSMVVWVVESVRAIRIRSLAIPHLVVNATGPSRADDPEVEKERGDGGSPNWVSGREKRDDRRLTGL
jgi:hypothetical protein